MLKLTALSPNNPMAVMTAYGALRLLPGARLRWADAHPELDYAGDAIADLAALVPERAGSPEYVQYREPQNIEDYAAAARALPHEWLVALRVQASKSAQGDKKLDRLTLRLLRGNHRMIENANRVLQALGSAPVVSARIEEALVGPWLYEDRVRTGKAQTLSDSMAGWGWDPMQVRDSETTDKEPSSMPNRGVAGAYWLAWESLPLWPIVGRQTIGMSRDAWRYPICAEWLDVELLRDLLLGAETPGVRWYSARKIRSGESHVFAWAQRE